MSEHEARLAIVHLESGDARYAQTIRAGHHTIAADEPKSAGGEDAGPTPYGLLASALAACTSITLRMYADRKSWELGAIRVDVAVTRTDGGERIERTIRFANALTDEQRSRLAEIADKTPVTKTLKRGTEITTVIAA
jgi:putative redox protein